jgi:hypothetical protein
MWSLLRCGLVTNTIEAPHGSCQTSTIRYYCDLVIIHPDGTWQANIGIGNPEDVGEPYKIGVLLANQDADAIIRQRRIFPQYLPAGSAIQGTIGITVYRR